MIVATVMISLVRITITVYSYGVVQLACPLLSSCPSKTENKELLFPLVSGPMTTFFVLQSHSELCHLFSRKVKTHAKFSKANVIGYGKRAIVGKMLLLRYRPK